MNKKLIIVFDALVILFNFIAMIVSLGPSFYKYRSTSTQYYGNYHNTTKGDWSVVNLSSTKPGLLVFIILSAIASIIVAIILLIFVISKKSTLGIMFAQIGVLLFQIIVGTVAIFSSFSLGSSSTTGIAHAWSSSGTQFELGASGGWFVFLTISAQLLLIATGVFCFTRGYDFSRD